MIKKRDIILALMMILLGIAGYGVIRLGQKKGSQVVIYVDQKEIGRYDLDTDTTKEIQAAKGTNTLVIENSMAYVTDADCPDQLCVHQKAASKNHESIICLPNKVVVEVDGSEESEFDAVAN